MTDDDIFDDVWNMLRKKKTVKSAQTPKKTKQQKKTKKTKQIKKIKKIKEIKEVKKIKIPEKVKIKQPKKVQSTTVAETRERKVCPQCKSIDIFKLRHHNGFFKCKGCNAVFQVPAVKQVKIDKNIPEMLKEIMEQKQRRKAAELQENVQ